MSVKKYIGNKIVETKDRIKEIEDSINHNIANIEKLKANLDMLEKFV